MSDNLKNLKEVQVDSALPLAGGVESILVANHNPLEKEIISKVGRMVGFPFNAQRSPTAGVIPSGSLFWNANAMNKDDVSFTISLGKFTQDGNDIRRILGILGVGDFIHFKDFVGRSTTLKFLGFTDLVDLNLDPYFDIEVEGFGENLNYAYQVGENEPCMISFISGVALNVLHTTGDESKTGTLSFLNTFDGEAGISMINSGALPSQAVFYISNDSNNGIGANIWNNSNGGIGLVLNNTLNGTGLYLVNLGTGQGMISQNDGLGIGAQIYNNGLGIGLHIDNGSTDGRGIVINGSTAFAGYLFEGKSNNVTKITIDKNGNVLTDGDLETTGLLKVRENVNNINYVIIAEEDFIRIEYDGDEIVRFMNNPAGAGMNLYKSASDSYFFDIGQITGFKNQSPINASGLIPIVRSSAPLSSTDTGVKGEIYVDANFIYYCYATNLWRRTAGSSF